MTHRSLVAIASQYLFHSTEWYSDSLFQALDAHPAGIKQLDHGNDICRIQNQ
jgi:hypothetical protein